MILIVVRDSLRAEALRRFAPEGIEVVEAGHGSTMGLRLTHAFIAPDVFGASPDTDKRILEWIECSVETRLKPGGGLHYLDSAPR